MNEYAFLNVAYIVFTPVVGQVEISPLKNEAPENIRAIDSADDVSHPF
jgi:hypothetical protein